MSIINEALKKAGKEKSALEPAGALNSGTHVPLLDLGPKKYKEPFNWGPLFVIFVLLLITGPIVAPLFSVSFRKTGLPSIARAPEETQTPASVTQGSNHRKQFAVEEAPLFQPAASPFAQPPFLTLSGIVYSPSDAYCIINNKIIKPGESIQDAKLVAVTENQVVLDFKGQKIKLFVS